MGQSILFAAESSRPPQLRITKRRIAAAAVLATGLLGVGLPAASAHTGDLQASGICQDDGTRLVTYTGTTNNVPATGAGHQATLTVGDIVPAGTTASPSTQDVVGNTTYSFTQTIPGDATSAAVTASLVWGDGAQSAPKSEATFTTSCTPVVVVPAKPAPTVVATDSEDEDCDSKEVTTTTVTTTTGWVLKDNVWVKDKPVTTESVKTRPTTPKECPVVVPPVVVPPVDVPPVDVPPAVVPPVEVLGVSAVAPVVAPAVTPVANPLPTAAAAGQADASGLLRVGTITAFAAFLMLGAGFVLRRRRG